MLPPELLELLVCPETEQEVRLAGPGEVAALNAAIGRGELRTASGAAAEPLDGALVRADGAVAYPVRDAIPVMLVSEALPIAHLALAASTAAPAHG